MRYITLKLPEDFISKYVDVLVESDLGFSSRAELIKTAVREYYEKLKDKKMFEATSENSDNKRKRTTRFTIIDDQKS